MRRITPCLWFDGRAEEAMNFYAGIFANAKIGDIMRRGDAGPGQKGSILSVMFELDGQEFIGLNGGPMFTFAGDFVLRAMRNAGGGRSVLGQVVGGRHASAMRLADG
jgi:predicted 3-demethylubiquinone-9 3-methyltransferase (glyoxalase superfamily)